MHTKYHLFYCGRRQTIELWWFHWDIGFKHVFDRNTTLKYWRVCKIYESTICENQTRLWRIAWTLIQMKKNVVSFLCAWYEWFNISTTYNNCNVWSYDQCCTWNKRSRRTELWVVSVTQQTIFEIPQLWTCVPLITRMKKGFDLEESINVWI